MAVLSCLTVLSLSLGLLLWIRQIWTEFAATLDTTALVVSIFYLAKLVSSGLRRLLPKQRVSPVNKAVFITGCDTGFGHETAKRLDAEGFHVFAGCLKPEEEGALELKSSCSSRLHIVPLDVTSDESVSNALHYITKHLEKQEFWAVVNNAGIARVGELEWAAMDDFKSVFDVNTWGVVRVTQAFLPLLRRSKGRVVTVTSIAAHLPSPCIGVYTMSKFATRAFCEVLLMEMKKWGVNVSMIEPFAYTTAMTKLSNISLLDDTWKNVPAGVKADYGDEYFQSLRKYYLKLMFVRDSRVHQVVECIYDAISNKEPKLHYRPSPLYFKLMLSFLQFFPESAVNSVIAWCSTAGIKPSMLNKEIEGKEVKGIREKQN